MVDQLFERILHKVALLTNTVADKLALSHTPLTLDMMPCYRTLVNNFSNTCLNINKVRGFHKFAIRILLNFRVHTMCSKNTEHDGIVISSLLPS